SSPRASRAHAANCPVGARGGPSSSPPRSRPPRAPRAPRAGGTGASLDLAAQCASSRHDSAQYPEIRFSVAPAEQTGANPGGCATDDHVHRRSAPEIARIDRASNFWGTHKVRRGGSMPRVKRTSWLLGAVVLGSVAGVACKGDAKQDAKTIRIGVITSITGAQAAFGAAHKNGY